MDKEIIIAIVLILVAIYWATFQWNICKEAGFDFWYCIQHIS